MRSRAAGSPGREFAKSPRAAAAYCCTVKGGGLLPQHGRARQRCQSSAPLLSMEQGLKGRRHPLTSQST